MEDRFKNILNLLSQDFMTMAFRDSPYIITGFKKTAERAPDWYKFQLERDFTPLKYMPDSPFTNLEKRDESLYVNFYSPIPDDNVFTVTIEHYFGYLNLSGIDDYQRVEQLGQLLVKNFGTFLATGAYLGITYQKNILFTSLNSMLHFLDEWSDNQIAKILSFQLAGMFKGLENHWDDSLTILKRSA